MGFGFLLQDMWGTGTKPWKKFGMFDKLAAGKSI
jgi:hypothetical protein